MRPRYTCAAALVTCLFLTAPPDAGAVNLLSNPSFETYSSCPTSFSQLNLAGPWDVPNTGTSDYFNTCVTGWPPFPVPDVPLSPLGYQFSRTGSGHGGIIPYSSAADYREYLQSPLSSALLPGQTYTVTFYVNLADSCIIAIDRIGAYFSIGPVGPVFNYAPLPYTPQIESPVSFFLADTLNWMAVTGTFVAAGGEDHIVIGNFHDDASTNTIPGPGQWPGGAYYYVDDVLVELVAPVEQACCTSDGFCTMQYPDECTLLGGLPLGAGVDCSPDPCGPVPARQSTWSEIKIRLR